MFLGRPHTYQEGSPSHSSSPVQSCLNQIRHLAPRRLRFRCRRTHRHTRSTPSRFDRSLAKFFTLVRSLLQFWATHVLLIMFLMAYTVFGAYVFRGLEMEQQQTVLKRVVQTRIDVSEELWRNCHDGNITDKERWNEVFMSIIWGHLPELCTPGAWEGLYKGYNRPSDMWSVQNSMIYCITVFTTIGYGFATPKTVWGQLFTIIYSLLGIPYSLFVLGDIGQVLQSNLKRLYIALYKFYYLGKCCKWKCTPPATLVHRFALALHCFFSEGQHSSKDHMDEMAESRGSSVIYHSGNGDDSLYMMTGLRDSDFVVPVKVGLLLIFCYVMVGSYLFTVYEDWEFTVSLYFIFVSLTTIGFGDFLPENMNLFLVFLYMFMGLALGSLFFRMLLEYWYRIMTKAKRKITRAWSARISVVEGLGESPDNDVERGHEPGRLLEVFVAESLSVMHLSKASSLSDFQSKTALSSPGLTRKFQHPVVLVQISDSRFFDYTHTEDLGAEESTTEEALFAAARDVVLSTRRGRPFQQVPVKEEPHVLHITENGLYEYMKERMAMVQGTYLDPEQLKLQSSSQQDAQITSKTPPRQPPPLSLPSISSRTSPFLRMPYRSQATRETSPTESAGNIPPWKPLIPLQESPTMMAKDVSSEEELPNYTPLRRYEPASIIPRSTVQKQASFAAVPEVHQSLPHHWVRTHLMMSPKSSAFVQDSSSGPIKSPSSSKLKKNKKNKDKHLQLEAAAAAQPPQESILAPRPITPVPRPPPPTPQQHTPKGSAEAEKSPSETTISSIHATQKSSTISSPPSPSSTGGHGPIALLRELFSKIEWAPSPKSQSPLKSPQSAKSTSSSKTNSTPTSLPSPPFTPPLKRRSSYLGPSTSLQQPMATPDSGLPTILTPKQSKKLFNSIEPTNEKHSPTSLQPPPHPPPSASPSLTTPPTPSTRHRRSPLHTAESPKETVTSLHQPMDTSDQKPSTSKSLQRSKPT